MELHSTNNSRIVAAAYEWLGTPYMHQAQSKGLGCDCLGLIIGIYTELFGPPSEAPPSYTPYWAEHNPEEVLYMAMKKHLTELSNLKDALPGDVLLFRPVPNRVIKHAAILVEKPDTVHPNYWEIIHSYYLHGVIKSDSYIRQSCEMTHAFRFSGVVL